MPAVPGRGHDDLPAEVRARFTATRAPSLEHDALRAALSAAMAALFAEADAAGVPDVAPIQDAVGDRAA